MKSIRPNRSQLRKIGLPNLAMPKFAQITGMIVTSIVVLGSDMDVLLAVPLGILAGGLATFFVSLSDYQAATKKI